MKCGAESVIEIVVDSLSTAASNAPASSDPFWTDVRDFWIPMLLLLVTSGYFWYTIRIFRQTKRSNDLTKRVVEATEKATKQARRDADRDAILRTPTSVNIELTSRSKGSLRHRISNTGEHSIYTVKVFWLFRRFIDDNGQIFHLETHEQTQSSLYPDKKGIEGISANRTDPDDVLTLVQYQNPNRYVRHEMEIHKCPSNGKTERKTVPIDNGVYKIPSYEVTDPKKEKSFLHPIGEPEPDEATVQEEISEADLLTPVQMYNKWVLEAEKVSHTGHWG